MKGSIDLEFSKSFWLYLAILLLLIPFPWLISIITASVLHELGHITALYLMKIPIRNVRLEPVGAKILSGPMTGREELIAAASGPAAGMLLALLFPWFPQLALSGFVQSMFNLLPIMPFDGGRIFRIFASKFFGYVAANRIIRAAAILAAIIHFVLSILLFRFSIFLTAACLLIMFRCNIYRCALDKT